MKKLREIMRVGFLFVVQREAMVREAVRVMTANNVGIVLVLEGERLVGVFSERDVVRRVVDRGLDPDVTPVGDVMTTEIVVGDPDEDYQSAMRKMDQANIRHLLVVKGPQMLSMISIRDLIRVDAQDKGEEIRYLREYLYQVPPEPVRPGARPAEVGALKPRQAPAAEGVFCSTHSSERPTSNFSASSSVAKRVSETGRSMWRSPDGVEWWMVATADHLPSRMRSVATSMV
jgi:CBS domain-containing protein